jgi:hypothetical protein
MKNILIISLLAFASQVAQASETVEINRVKYTKYSEDEIRSMIVKMNSLQPDMSAKQVISIMGQPIREQLVSNSPPQRILVYPLSIVVSLYLNSRSREWAVSTPKLYGTPLCQTDEGTTQKDAIGASVTEYPAINCIPRKFGQSSAPQKSGMPTAKTSASWELLREVPARGIFSGSKQYFDAKNVELKGQIKVVRAMYSFDSVQRVSFAPPYKSYIELTWVSCDQAKIDSGENLFYKVTDYYAGDMGTGQLVKSSISKDGYENDALNWQKDYNETFTKKFCG